MQTVDISWLKSLEVFINVPDKQLQWFIDHSENRVTDDGEILFKPGETLTGPHIVIDGGIQFYMIQNGSRRDYITFGRGDITGYMPYSRGKVAGGYAVAVGTLHTLSFPTEKLPELIKEHFELTQAFVHVMSNRVRDFTALQQQNEKMMALGKLSAGLAHELNNPASAIARDSDSLKAHLKLDPKLFKDMVMIRIEEEQVDLLNKELFTVLTVSDNTRLSLKERMALEDAITDWFEDHDIENGYALAESFADFNFSVENLQACAAAIPPASLSPMFNLISNLLVTEKMVEDIQLSSKRIADLVSSIKNFTHMDRAQDKQFADIHTGIRNTLTMLGYKIRKGNIQVIEDYDETLPPVKGLIGELNQVWTNIIDNAIDAMELNGKGTLTIKTERDKDFVQVKLSDDGPGIPAEVLPNIFDPFYTTKPMGKGTGMGLEVVQRIIYQHNGSVKVKSAPGRTEFIVCFPLDN
ncbi:Histidine kinase-, DNA gyrase B-, and HSP90-like ATPase [Pedobacter westerhofensis]|uniref:histidine kinase n=1 Tax=Pedobacter westerhofensis TaxID=425512 RepID=A0A521BYK2_9SPHI|nr:ATP-binding protein [Pedobacter westerhofensis]SMO51651.1 Histidine kinase-, DNA gyrase B-, and HSP90-like ATPase [Pedobacter westerhofensis]